MKAIRTRVRARDITESHRVSSPLELLFDLTFVVAVGALVAQLAHKVAEGDAASTVGPFLMVFFAIWWAWNQFTWLASAYDNDDALYRVFTLIQMGGVLVLAAGVALAALGLDLGVCLLVLTAAPAVTVVGYETIGHRHAVQALERATR